MINLKNYIIESIFDIEDNIDNMDESIREEIKHFLKDNFKTNSTYQISKKPNKEGKFEVLSNGTVSVKNEHITSLTNGLFIWTNIKGNFNCSECNLLTSLEGSPKEVGESFFCDQCNILTSLEGAPEKVGGDFYCSNCNSLISLEGAPKEVNGTFNCGYCNSLTSLEGAPKEVGGGFYCVKCGRYFTQEDVKKVSNVKRDIKV